MSIFSVLNFKRKKNMETNQKLSEKEIELKRAEISKKRKEKRDALKCKVVEDRIARNKEIEDLLREYEIEAVYTYRSDRPAEIPAVITETSAFTDMERRITKYACHKVTVVGLTQKSVDIEGKYRMLIGYSIYNPIDNRFLCKTYNSHLMTSIFGNSTFHVSKSRSLCDYSRNLGWSIRAICIDCFNFIFTKQVFNFFVTSNSVFYNLTFQCISFLFSFLRNFSTLQFNFFLTQFLISFHILFSFKI
jgi:hypothetical protein